MYPVHTTCTYSTTLAYDSNSKVQHVDCAMFQALGDLQPQGGPRCVQWFISCHLHSKNSVDLTGSTRIVNLYGVYS